MQDIKRIAKKMVKDMKRRFPGVSEGSAQEGALVLFDLVMHYPDADADMLDKLFNAQISGRAGDAEDKGEDDHWSVELVNAELNNVIRPAFEKAVNAGVDPVPVLQANCGISESEARAAVAKLVVGGGEASTDSSDEDDTDNEDTEKGATDRYAKAVDPFAPNIPDEVGVQA